jgi:two-component system response regulator HydG
MTNARVLVVGNGTALNELVDSGLAQRGFNVKCKTSAEAALSVLDTDDFEVLLTDAHTEGMSGLELCKEALRRKPDLCVIITNQNGNLEHAIEAIRAGAYDLVTQPFTKDALAVSVERAVRHRTLCNELSRLKDRVATLDSAALIGESPAMQRVFEMIERVAKSDSSVLITGESGTGKELVAKSLHEKSGRGGPFLAINCAAMPEPLLESELFGHNRGAFTDAKTSRSGLFVDADKGTLLLDEIGEMPLGMQAKLLRALQHKTVRPLGGAQEVEFDARIIAATNRDLEEDVNAKQFREDLYYRINVVLIRVPPLRARGTDVLLLAQYFLNRAAQRCGKSVTRMGRAVAEKLIEYDWPGNVRELENCMERAITLAEYDELTVNDLPAKVRDRKTPEVFGGEQDLDDLPPMRVVEQRYIRRVLDAVGGNKTLASKMLGFDRRTLYRKISRWD